MLARLPLSLTLSPEGEREGQTKGAGMRDPLLTTRARTMRQQLTEPERRLWVELRAKRFHGAKFRRQQVIGTYIADFACRSPMLVIEVDGESHAERGVYDAARTTFLEERGYRVLRFTNGEITQNIAAVLKAIEAVLRPPPLPDPLP